MESRADRIATPRRVTDCQSHLESGKTAFWASTSDELRWDPIVEDLVMAMVPGLDVDDEN